MGFGMLAPQTPLLDGLRLAKDWYRWMEQLWRHTGAGETNHPRYADLAASSLSMEPLPGLNAPDIVNIAGGGTSSNPGIWAYGFDAARREHLAITYVLPTAYVPGTDLTPYILWMPRDASSGDVLWRVEIAWINVGAEIATIDLTPPSSAEYVAAAPGVANKLCLYTLPSFSGAGMEPGSVLITTWGRRADVAFDTYAADAVILQAGFKYMTNGVGTVNQFP